MHVLISLVISAAANAVLVEELFTPLFVLNTQFSAIFFQDVLLLYIPGFRWYEEHGLDLGRTLTVAGSSNTGAGSLSDLLKQTCF